VDWFIGFAMLPIVTGIAAVIGWLMIGRPVLGDSLFVLAMFTTIWLRRFGARATQLGSLMVAPLVATLIVHMTGPLRPWWPVLIALIAYTWVFVCHRVAVASGITVSQRPVRAAASAGSATARRRLRASTRMAIQLATALVAAFVIGRLLWPAHWAWVVLTAYVVCSGARGRADVIFKGILRGGGAVAGTLVGLGISDLFPPHAAGAVVLMFVLLALGTWLREFNYAFWAAAMTATLSLLYGWFGESASGLLPIRLAGIAVGAALAMAASWLLMPIRTRDVVRRGSALAVGELAEILADDWRDPSTLRRRLASLTSSTERLEQVGTPLRFVRSLFSRLLPNRQYQADVIDVVRRCVQPARVVARAATENSGVRTSVAPLADAIAANATVVNRVISRQAGARHQSATGLELPTTTSATESPDNGGRSHDALVAALRDIEGVLTELRELFSDKEKMRRKHARRNAPNCTRRISGRIRAG
jgi:uncharacterized membrane protein YccC